MNRQSIIVARFLLCAAAALGAAAWGGGKPEEKGILLRPIRIDTADIHEKEISDLCILQRKKAA